MYTKLFAKILDSSVWLEPTATRIVWITLLAAMDEEGYARLSSVQNLAHRARVTDEEARAAVTALESPDPARPGQDRDGRRIERVPEGWLVINAEKYRKLATKTMLQEQTRLRVQRYRARAQHCNGVVTAVTPSNTPTANVTYSDTDTDVHTEVQRADEDVRVAPSAATRSPKKARPTWTGASFVIFDWQEAEFQDILQRAGKADFALGDWYTDVDQVLLSRGEVLDPGQSHRWLMTQLIADADLPTPRLTRRDTKTTGNLTALRRFADTGKDR